MILYNDNHIVKGLNIVIIDLVGNNMAVSKSLEFFILFQYGIDCR